MNKNIYVVDDEKKIRDIIKIYLENDGYHVETFQNGEDVLSAVKKKMPDMLIIDIMMPGIDGYDVCKEIRKTSDTPIIIVSAKDDTFDKILGIELGSDDYLVKPFSPRELVVRVKNIFKRVNLSETQIKKEVITIILKDITVNCEQRTVLKEKQLINFTTKEYDLLVFLMENADKVFNRNQLIDKVWGYEFALESRLVDDVIKRIRKKLKENESELSITTVWGYGYKIER